MNIADYSGLFAILERQPETLWQLAMSGGEYLYMIDERTKNSYKDQAKISVVCYLPKRKNKSNAQYSD